MQFQPSTESAAAAAELRATLRREFELASPDALFPPSVIAVVIGRTPRWLELARHHGTGPAFCRSGGRFVENRRGVVQLYGARTLYRKSDVVAWAASQPRFTSTRTSVPDGVAA